MSLISLVIPITFIIRGALMLVYVGLMFYVSWQLSLIILVCFGALSLSLGRFFKLK